MLGRVAVEMKVCLCRALIPSVEGALPQGETRLSHSVCAVCPVALAFTSPLVLDLLRLIWAAVGRGLCSE
jgi:hypothetical protein